MAFLTLLSGPLDAYGQSDPVLFELSNDAYRIGDLPPKLRALLAKQQARHYSERRELLDQLAFDAYLDDQAKATGRSRAELSRELLFVPKPSEADARKFYDANKGRIVEDFEQVKGRILKSMRAKRIAAKKRATVQGLERSGTLSIALSPPQPPPIDLPVGGYPALGPADAPFTVVEFADFSCPLCKQASVVMHNLHDAYPDKLRWVFVHYPVGKRGIAAKLHQGGQCLMEQDLFWKYHDLVFETLAEVKANDAPKLAAAVGADMDKFEACYSGNTGKWSVKRSLELGRKLGVRRTPTLYLNGRPFASNRLEQDLRDRIDPEAG